LAGKLLRVSLRDFMYIHGSDYRIPCGSSGLVSQAVFKLAPCYPIGFPSQLPKI